MSFNNANFSFRSFFVGANLAPLDSVKKEWDYSTSDTFSTVGADQYFVSVSDRLRAGDLVYVSSSTDGDAIFYITNAQTSTSSARKL